MSQTITICNICKAEGTMKYISSLQHTKTKKHQKALLPNPEPVLTKQEKKHNEYVKYIKKKGGCPILK
jgi:hypothetical protein